MAKRKKKEEKSDTNDRKLFAFLAVLLSVLGFVLALLAKKNDKYVMFYAKQSLVLFLTGIAVKILTVLLAISIIGIILIPIIWVVYGILFLIALIYSLSGVEKETPLVGKYARSINL